MHKTYIINTELRSFDFLNPDIMVYDEMFVSVYSSSNGSRYMRIIQSARRGRQVQHRHVLSLGPYDERTLHRYRAIVAEWKPLERSAVVLEELASGSGPLQGRGFFRSFRRWCTRPLKAGYPSTAAPEDRRESEGACGCG